MGVTAAAMLVALADALIPAGSVQKIARFTGGLLLLVAILQPVGALDYSQLARSLSQARGDLQGYEAEPSAENFLLMKSIIEARCAAYIEDKAAQLDMDCRAQVTCTAQEEHDYPYPAAATITGALNKDQQAKLSRLIEADLAIPAKHQTFQEVTPTQGGSGRQEGGETP